MFSEFLTAECSSLSLLDMGRVPGTMVEREKQQQRGKLNEENEEKVVLLGYFMFLSCLRCPDFLLSLFNAKAQAMRNKTYLQSMAWFIIIS